MKVDYSNFVIKHSLVPGNIFYIVNVFIIFVSLSRDNMIEASYIIKSLLGLMVSEN